jgi:predicted flavoprotein YhiN
MSGGGRCNFTNLYTEPANFLSQNAHFCKSALARYTQWDFIELVAKHGVPYHEKKLGQLFCDNKASDILDMLLAECDEAGAELRMQTSIHKSMTWNSSNCFKRFAVLNSASMNLCC